MGKAGSGPWLQELTLVGGEAWRPDEQTNTEMEGGVEAMLKVKAGEGEACIIQSIIQRSPRNAPLLHSNLSIDYTCFGSFTSDLCD